MRLPYVHHFINFVTSRAHGMRCEFIDKTLMTQVEKCDGGHQFERYGRGWLEIKSQPKKKKKYKIINKMSLLLFSMKIRRTETLARTRVCLTFFAFGAKIYVQNRGLLYRI